MKKIVLILVLLCCGCGKSVYDEYVTKIKNMNQVSTQMPFNVEFHIDDVNEERIIYQIVIDDAKYDLKDVSAFVINDSKSKDVFPSIGVLDEKINLNDKTKGINLVGYAIKKEMTFKLLVIANGIEYLITYNYR